MQNNDNIINLKNKNNLLNMQEKNLKTVNNVFFCFGCNMAINTRYFLQVDNTYWHENCLRCASCNQILTNNCKNNEPFLKETKSTCFFKQNRPYCKDDHLRLFAKKCNNCDKSFKSTDLVFRTQQLIFHLQCFQCVYCAQQLKKGDFYFCVEQQIICHRDYNLMFLCRQFPLTSVTPIPPIHGINISNSCEISDKNYELNQSRHCSLINSHHHNNLNKIPKRPRTILNAQQRKAFKYTFERGLKPSRKVREQLAKDTGLSVRVVQVWFQNQRAKIKKEQRKQETDSGRSMTVYTDSDRKSVIEDESLLKSETDSELDEFDLDEDVLSKRSSVSHQSSIYKNEKLNEDLCKLDNINSQLLIDNNSLENPIDKLYRMHQTYFSFI